MEENVALDSSKQKQFMKSLKGLKRLMKKSEKQPKTEEPEKKDEVEQVEKPKEQKNPQKKEKVLKKKRKSRGLVYLSHIPHGFYEHEMTQYFKQFGVVTNVRVIRSKRTGRSKGHAFVEFKNVDVAQVVAETMNNYLMGKRLIKAVYIPPKDQRKNVKRMNWNDQYNPGSVKKLQMKKAYNSNKSEKDDLKIAKKLLSNLSNTKNKLKELGIDYDFFTPVDVPEALSNTVIVKEEDDKDAIIKSDEKTQTKESKGKDKQNASNVNVKNDTGATTSNVVEPKEGESKKSKKKNKKQKKKSGVTDIKTIPNNESINKANKEEQAVKNANKRNKTSSISKPEIEQDQKQTKKKNAGVKPPEDFIKLGGEDNEDSDSSYHFDSDEFENMINNDDSDNSDAEEISDVKNGDKKKSKDLPAKPKKEEQKITAPKIQVNQQNNRQQQQNKRKGPERAAVQTKKPKFEKQSKKKLPNKQIKKKK